MSAEPERDFVALVEPHRPSLRLHCYRMLGSSHDCDDMVQETLLRAWRARASLSDPSRAGAWLHRMATNVCLDELARRPRRALAMDLSDPADPTAPHAAPIEDAAWLEPMPDAWLAGARSNPAARYAVRESVALAFVAALQVLSPTQRAILLLRDVVGLSASETAAALDRSVAATESALHRARGHRGEGRAARAPTHSRARIPRSAGDRRFRHRRDDRADARRARDHDAPLPTWIAGYEANVVFYRAMFARWGGPGVARVEPVGVNGRPGFAFHRDGELRAIEAVETRDGKILRVHHFMQASVLDVFRPYLSVR